ncbi:MAG: hypothetical protein ACREI9_15410 [Nitrospiraceae bacterium]
MARPRTTLSMDIGLRSGGTFRLQLEDNGSIRRQQTPVVSVLSADELKNIQALESQFFNIAELINKLT